MDMKRIVLFLGAGASVPFGKPTTAQLKDTLRPPDSEIRNNFRNLILTCTPYIDFEHVYYNALKIRDFLQSSSGLFFKYVSEVQNALYTYREPGVRHVKFHDTMDEWDSIIRSLEEDVFENYGWNDKSDENLKAIFDPIFEWLKEQSEELVVCSTNYDKALENYCELKKYSCVDGFQEIRGSHRWVKGQFYYPRKTEGETYVYLYKLHGSLDWKENRRGEVIKTNEEGQSTDRTYKRNLLIYPTIDPKPMDFDPFMTIMKEFKKRMNEADACIVIGFSFRDKHISNTLAQFKSKKNNKLIIIDDKAINVLYKNILGREVPTSLSVMELVNGINSYNITGDNTELILHNIEKNKINDIVLAVKELISTHS